MKFRVKIFLIHFSGLSTCVVGIRKLKVHLNQENYIVQFGSVFPLKIANRHHFCFNVSLWSKYFHCKELVKKKTSCRWLPGGLAFIMVVMLLLGFTRFVEKLSFNLQHWGRDELLWNQHKTKLFSFLLLFKGYSATNEITVETLHCKRYWIPFLDKAKEGKSSANGCCVEIFTPANICSPLPMGLERVHNWHSF